MRPAESTTLPPDVRAAKTMLSAQELELLYVTARDQYTGRGEIVDGGAFLGGSTLALARGLSENPRQIKTRGRIHSYDLFVADSFAPQFIEGYPEGTSTRPYYDGVIAEVASYVTVHEGDLTNCPWPASKDIEVLFIDVAKSWETNDSLLKTFFPKLIPGVSTVIQQDFHWPHTPWIGITMELLADHVTHLGSMPWATAYYRWEKAIEPGQIPARLFDLGPDRLVELATRAQRFERGSREWTSQQCNLVVLHQSLGRTAIARDIYDETLSAAPQWMDYFKFTLAAAA